MYGGSDRSNASVPIILKNGSLSTGVTYTVDISMGAVLLVLPAVNKTANFYEFTFKVIGEQYSWWESWIVGPNGETYFIVALATAGAVGLLIVVGSIVAIVLCCCKRG